MADTVYYRFRDEPKSMPPNTEVIGYEYRKFSLFRDGEYLHWRVKQLDGSEAPPELQGSYTARSRCERAVDDFLANENLKQSNE